MSWAPAHITKNCVHWISVRCIASGLRTGCVTSLFYLYRSCLQNIGWIDSMLAEETGTLHGQCLKIGKVSGRPWWRKSTFFLARATTRSANTACRNRATQENRSAKPGRSGWQRHLCARVYLCSYTHTMDCASAAPKICYRRNVWPH